MKPGLRLALGVLFGGALSACAVGNQLVAGSGEYQLYRETHIGKTLERRLAAGNRYLKREPGGRYAADVKAWFAPAERAYVARAWNSLPHLRAYLAALPDGPSADEVKGRADELLTTVRFAEKREQKQQQHVDSLQANLERAAEQRKAFVDEVSAWVRSFSAIKGWDMPPSGLEPELLGRLGGDKLGDACLGDLCSRAFTPRFAIPFGDGKLVPREAAYGVELVLKAGVVSEARVRGRELFSRLGEALDRRAVSFSDPQSRAEAIGRALSVVVGALGTAFPQESCERAAVSPVVLERACSGSRVVATAALTTGEDDVIAFGPEAPAPSPTEKPAKAPPGKAGPGAAKKRAP